MSKPMAVLVVALMALSFALGALLVGYAPAALAQDNDAKPADKPADDQPSPAVAALLKVQPVVAAVPLATRTDYEQDPFEPTRLRRTESTTLRVLLIRADGTTEVKSAP